MHCNEYDETIKIYQLVNQDIDFVEIHVHCDNCDRTDYHIHCSDCDEESVLSQLFIYFV